MSISGSVYVEAVDSAVGAHTCVFYTSSTLEWRNH